MSEKNFNEMSEEEREAERRRLEEQDAANMRLVEEFDKQRARVYFENTHEESDAQMAAADQHLLNMEAGALNAKSQKEATPTAPTAPKPDNHLKSVGDPATGGSIVVGTGMRKADDRSWEKDYNAMLQRRAAARAGRQAAADERQRLLDSGMYFDDGRGNIKLKKEYREHQRVGNGGRRTYNETRADNGSAKAMMRQAYNKAQDGFYFALAAQEDENANKSLEKTRAMVSANKAYMESMEKRKTDAKQNRAKGMLGIYDGMVAAYKDLTDELNADRIQDEMRTVYGDFKKDQFGRVTTERDSKQVATGRKFRNGFVSPDQIANINANLRRRGVNMEITGIVAQELYNPVAKKGAGKPYFLVQGYRFDENTGTSVPIGHRFSFEDVYRFGVDHGKDSGLDAARAESNVAKTLQDIYGVLASGEKPSVRAAEIRAMSNETIARIKDEGLSLRTDKNNAVKLEIAKLTGEQRKEIADANNVLKKYGIDIGLEKTQENNASRERIAAEREKGRQARAVLRDKQAWEKLALEWEKADNSFAVQMKKADTYGKRVDLIEQKIDKDYEVALKKVKNDEDRLALDEAYKNAKLDLEEGRLDLDWLKVDSAAEQKELDRQNALKIAELRAKATSAGKSGAVAPSRLKEINAELDAYGKILKAPYDEENRQKAIDGITRLTQELHLDGDKKSNDGLTKRRVSYNDLQPGTVFSAKGKDGKVHKFRKTETGYERID